MTINLQNPGCLVVMLVFSYAAWANGAINEDFNVDSSHPPLTLYLDRYLTGGMSKRVELRPD